MAFFKSIQEKVSYDDYIESIMAGNNTPKYLGISALKNSDVLTAVSIIAGDIARFPIIKTDLENNIIPDEELNYLMNVRATSNATARDWKFAMAVNAILSGNSYSRKLRDPTSDKTLQYIFYRPSEVSVEMNDDKELQYTFTDSLTGKTTHSPSDDVVHWKFFTHDTITGRSPLLSLAEEIGLQESGVDTLTRFFKSGFSSGVLKMLGSNLNADAKKLVRQEFDKSREGSTGGSPIVLDSTMEYTPLEIDTNVLQLINSNNYSTAQIAKCLRIPAYKLAVNSPNQSVKQLNEDYITNDLPFYFDPITSEHMLKNFDEKERRKYRLEFDTRSITGRNVDEIVKLTDKGLLTPNQGLIQLGLTPSDDPNMNRHQSSLNFVFLDKKEEYQNQNGSKNVVKSKGGDDKNENDN